MSNGAGSLMVKIHRSRISGDGVGMNPLMLLPVTHLDLLSLLLLHWALQILLSYGEPGSTGLQAVSCSGSLDLTPRGCSGAVGSPSWEGQWSLMIEARRGCFHNMGSWRNMSSSLHIKAPLHSPCLILRVTGQTWSERSIVNWGLDVSHE